MGKKKKNPESLTICAAEGCGRKVAKYAILHGQHGLCRRCWSQHFEFPYKIFKELVERGEELEAISNNSDTIDEDEVSNFIENNRTKFLLFAFESFFGDKKPVSALRLACRAYLMGYKYGQDKSNFERLLEDIEI